ncbi:MAG TPA: asparaginase [Acidimicrobiia bacterium]|nr:asparaginase [Acidimicrobiia bacterium]
MFVGVERSGLIETFHEVVAAAVGPDGRVIATLGADLERPFFLRSALKPFQALVSSRAGADLRAESLAVACASHGGYPVHLAYVRSMLIEVGLDESALRCPPARPAARSADRIAAVTGRDPAPIFHNCSGKHAGMLRACVAQGWPLEYRPADHPLQERVLDLAADVTGGEVAPVGVDGCGVPTVRGTVVDLARAFSRLATDDEFLEVRTAMARFPALTAGLQRGDDEIARWIPGAVKGGAEACLGIAWYGGVGIAAKAWSGNNQAVVVAALAMAQRLGIVSPYQDEMLSSMASPAVFGGGRRVGSMVLEGG